MIGAQFNKIIISAQLGVIVNVDDGIEVQCHFLLVTFLSNASVCVTS